VARSRSDRVVFFEVIDENPRIGETVNWCAINNWCVLACASGRVVLSAIVEMANRRLIITPHRAITSYRKTTSNRR
jgi:hypothetical protein